MFLLNGITFHFAICNYCRYDNIMSQLELINILKKLLFLTIFFFILFLFFVNAVKYLGYLLEIDRVVTFATKYQDKRIEKIENQYTEIEGEVAGQYDFNKAYPAQELGFIDYLTQINSSEWGDGINILIIGSDKKDFLEKKSRADVIIVMRINKQGKILSISIPRDTLVKVSPHSKFSKKDEYDKIGHSLYWDGLDGLKYSVENLLGSPIYRTIIIDNFRTFEAFLAIIGGVTIDKQLEGKLGIQWIRNRQFKFGDIERCKRQQVFLTKSVNKLWKISKKGSVVYSSLFFDHFKKLIDTDIEKKDFYNILYLLKKNQFNPEKDFHSCILQGNFGEYESRLFGNKKISCWILDKKIVEIIQFLFYSEIDIQQHFFTNSNVKYTDLLKFEIKELFDNMKNNVKAKIDAGKEKFVKTMF